MNDPDVWTLREAAEKLRVSYSRACDMARAGDFPGIIPLRHSGRQRKWLVSVHRFNQLVHGSPPEIETSLRTGEDQAGTHHVSGLSELDDTHFPSAPTRSGQGRPAPTSPASAPLLRRGWGDQPHTHQGRWEPCAVTEPIEPIAKDWDQLKSARISMGFLDRRAP